MKYLYKGSVRSAVRSSFYGLVGLFVGAAHLPGAAQPTLNGQYQESRYDLTPVRPSPKVAKLGIYGDIPVDNYTGIPDVKIPLYTYLKNGLELPIYLSYHSTGLLVDERASEVGLGWSLHAGGVIGHTIFGYNDEYVGGYGSGQAIPLPNISPPADVYNFYKEAGQNQHIDSEPDVYNFSYGDQAGRYVRDFQGTPRTTPFRDIKIDNNVITDERGVKYVFTGREEHTQIVYGSYCVLPPPGNFSVDSRRDFVSARYLTQIISPTNDTIRLGYTADTTLYHNPADYTLTRLRLAPQCTEVHNYNNVPGYNPCINDTRHIGYKISSITSSNGVTVRFLYDAVRRLDCVGGHRLQAIEIADGHTTKRFDFYQSYFASSGGNGGTDPLSASDTRRLRLDSLREQGTPSYKFSYHVATGYDFPAVGSFSQDVMGYYNGKYNGSLVATQMLDAKTILVEPTPVPGVNRQIDTAAVKQGMLERITYPTGGFSQFVYEANSSFIDRHFPVDSSASLVALQVSANDDVYPGPSNTLTQTFTLSQPTRVRMECSLRTPLSLNANFYVLVENTVTRQTVYAMPPGPSDDSTVTMPAGTYRVSALAQDVATGLPVLVYAYASALYQHDVYIGNYPFYGCRIKSIKSSGRTAFGQDVQKVYSYITPANPGQSSGYVLYQPQLKYSKTTREAHESQPYPNVHITSFYICNYDVLSQSPVNPVGSIHGGSIAYSQVQVIQKSPTADVRTDYVYSTTPDGSADWDADVTRDYPFPPPTSMDWQRGLLLKKTTLRNQNGVYSPVQVTRNTYRAFFDRMYLDSGVNPAQLPASNYHLTVIPACRVLMVGPEVGTYQGVFLGFYYGYVSAFQYLAREDNTSYGPAGDSLATSKSFTYASPWHTQPTLIKTLTSGRDTVVTRLTYPEDYALGTASLPDARLSGLRGLQQYHIKTPVIESRTTLIRASGSFQELSNHLAEYRLFNQVPLLTKTWEWNVGGPGTFFPLAATPTAWTQDANYLPKEELSYASNYTVVSAKKSGDVPTSFLRSRDKEVVAQVRNAVPAQIAFTSFEPNATGRWQYDSLNTGSHYVPTHFTGTRGYQLDGTTSGALRRPGLAAGEYELWFWSHGTNAPQVSGATQQRDEVVNVAGPWHEHRLRLTLSANATVQVNSAPNQLIWIDEVRLHPVGAQLTTYTQRPLVGPTSQTDPSGRTVTYEYDALGRLQRARDEQGRVLTEQQYHYARP